MSHTTSILLDEYKVKAAGRTWVFRNVHARRDEQGHVLLPARERSRLYDWIALSIVAKPDRTEVEQSFLDDLAFERA